MDEKNNSDMTSVFQILEIEPTNDKRAIKRAYAKLVKQYHPEEYPEKWKQIHDAYMAALEMSEYSLSKDLTADMQSESALLEEITAGLHTMPEQKEPEDIQEAVQEVSVSDEITALWGEISQLSADQQKQDEEQRRQVLQKLISRFQKMAKKRHYDKKEWENFFYQPDILPLISRKEFLYQLGNQLADQEIDDELYTLLKDQLRIIRRYRADRKMRALENGGPEPVKYAESKIEAARREERWFKRLKNRIRRRSEGIYVAVGVGLALAAVFLHGIVMENLREPKSDSNTLWDEIASQKPETVQDIKTAQNKEKIVQPSQSVHILEKDTVKEYQYLKEVRLSYDDAACRVFIPDVENALVEQDCAEGERSGIAVNTFFIETSEEKDATMKNRIETLCQQIGDSEQYQNVSVTEALSMPNYLNAEYTALYCEKIDVQGEPIPMMYIEGYTVLKENDGIAKEVIISMVISQPVQETESVSGNMPDRAFNEILEELQRAYSIDLHRIMQ